MERPLNMLLHGALITVVLYLLMKFIFKQSNLKAEKYSIIVGTLATQYMLIFGHKLPSINNITNF